jgi:hypothetical protein
VDLFVLNKGGFVQDKYQSIKNTSILVLFVLLAIMVNYLGVYLTTPKEIVEGPRHYGHFNQELESFLNITYLVKVFFLFLFTLLGIFAQILFYSKKLIFNMSLLKPLLLSPIVFFSVYLASKTQTDNVISLLLAFQNGFFWQTILKKIERKNEKG